MCEQPTLSVIVPVFNEANWLRSVVLRVHGAPYSKHVLIVDDGSSDGTSAIARELCEELPDVEWFRHGANLGKGAAIRTALDRANGLFTVIQDGDLECDPADYPKLLAPLLAGETDVVYGSRYLGRTRGYAGRRLMDLGVKVLNVAVWGLYGVRLTDQAAAYKIFPTEVLRAELQCRRFEFCAEVTAKACRLGLRIKEVAVRYTPRTRAEGKKLRLSDGMVALWTLGRYRRWKPAACGCSEQDRAGVQLDRCDAANPETIGAVIG